MRRCSWNPTAASLWRAEDGDAAGFEAFARRNFAADDAARKSLRDRMDRLHEQIDGSFNEMTRAFRWQSDVEAGPILPFDELFAGYDPSAHLNDDMFANKIAFVVLLNFPLTTLDEKLENGPQWTPEQWAEARMADRYARRLDFGVAAGTFVVVLTPMLEEAVMSATAGLVRSGLPVMVIDTLPRSTTIARRDGLDPATADLAWRLRRLERDILADQLAATGCPVVRWRGPGTLDEVLQRLGRQAPVPAVVR